MSCQRYNSSLTSYSFTSPITGLAPVNIHPDATWLWKNAERVHFDLETKINPRAEFADRTIAPEPFAQKAASVIMANGLQERADLQSFDFRSLLVVQEQFPQICTVYLFGDLSICADPAIAGSDDGTNLWDEEGGCTNTHTAHFRTADSPPGMVNDSVGARGGSNR
jgi:hypothetical protein